MKRFYTISLFFLLISCSSINCYNSLEGKYINTRDTKTINYLLIYNDGTYYHYFKNDTIELTCKGTWEKAKDVYCGIELDNFENYNELGSNYEEFGSYFLLKDGEYLNNGLDGNNEYSFIKSSETLTK